MVSDIVTEESSFFQIHNRPEEWLLKPHSDTGIILLLADEGNKIVIMEKLEYSKTNKFLSFVMMYENSVDMIRDTFIHSYQMLHFNALAYLGSLS